MCEVRKNISETQKFVGSTLMQHSNGLLLELPCKLYVLMYLNTRTVLKVSVLYMRSSEKSV